MYMFSSYVVAEKENLNPRASRKWKLSLSLGNKNLLCNVSQDEVRQLEKQQVPKATTASSR